MIECILFFTLVIGLCFVYETLDKKLKRHAALIDHHKTIIVDLSTIKHQLMDFVGRIRSLEESRNSMHLLYMQLSTELGQMYIDKNKRKTKKK